MNWHFLFRWLLPPRWRYAYLSMNELLYIAALPCHGLGAQVSYGEIRVSFPWWRPGKFAKLGFPEGGWSSHRVSRPKSHGKTSVALDHCMKCDVCVCISWWDSRPLLASLGVNCSPRHPAAEGLIWLPAFPFSDACTEQCVSLALVSVPLRPGSGQLEAQGETIIELN